MRKLWRGLLLGSVAGGVAYWLLRRRAGRAAGKDNAAYPVAQTARKLGTQWRDVQGAWRVGRRVMRKRRMLSGVTRFARRLLLR